MIVIKGTSDRAVEVLKALNKMAPMEFHLEALLVKPEPPKPPKKNLLLDAGHSKLEPGARSNDGTAKEEALTEMQAKLIAVELISAGIGADIFNPDVDDLETIGAKAKGYDGFISIHLNSYSGSSDPGTEVFVLPDATEADVAAATAVCNAVCKAIGTTNRGVKRARFTVIREAREVCTGPVMLIESFFLNPYSHEQATKKAIAAADAIADALISVLK